jgi:hypothetical protein
MSKKQLRFIGFAFGDFTPARHIEVVYQEFTAGDRWAVLKEFADLVCQNSNCANDPYIIAMDLDEIIVDSDAPKATWAIEALEGKHEVGFLEWEKKYYTNPRAVFEIQKK